MRKIWTSTQDELLTKLITQNLQKGFKWRHIAQKLQNFIQNSNRTGKQCRQRWHNHLNPSVENNKNWTDKQQQQLYRLQEEYGNRWALFANLFQGRTDNNIKNYFYSTLRKSLRKINSFISFSKKKGQLKAVKLFRQCTISKILAVSDCKFQKKIKIKAKQSIILAKNIRNLLVNLQRIKSQPSINEHQNLYNQLIQYLQVFNRNCRKKKNKKKRQLSDQQSQYQSEIKQQKNQNQPTSKIIDNIVIEKQINNNHKAVGLFSNFQTSVTSMQHNDNFEYLINKSKLQRQISAQPYMGLNQCPLKLQNFSSICNFQLFQQNQNPEMVFKQQIIQPNFKIMGQSSMNFDMFDSVCIDLTKKSMKESNNYDDMFESRGHNINTTNSKNEENTKKLGFISTIIKKQSKNC